MNEPIIYLRPHSNRLIDDDIRASIFKSFGMKVESRFKKKINLGCGADYLEGYTNIDVDDRHKADIHMNLDDPDVKLPFEDFSIDLIYASHVLEHIHHLPALKEEMIRVLKPLGFIVAVVPHFTAMDAWGDDTHVRAFSEHSFFPSYWPMARHTKFNFITATDSLNNENKWMIAMYQKQMGGEVSGK